MPKPTVEQVNEQFDKYYKDVELLVRLTLAFGDEELIRAAMRDAFLKGYYEAMTDVTVFLVEKGIKKPNESVH